MHDSCLVKFYCVWPYTQARTYPLHCLRTWEAKWEAKYLALRGFLRENGGRYPTKSLHNGLHSWVGNQRQAYVGTGDHVMTEDRAARLKLLPGWRWKASGARLRRAPGTTHAGATAAVCSSSNHPQPLAPSSKVASRTAPQ